MRDKAMAGGMARILTLALVVLALSVGSALACVQPTNLATQRAQLLAEVNAQRTRAGLRRLTVDSRLDRAAWAIACDNATRNRLSHTGGNGSTLASRLQAVGYAWRAANENLALANATPAQTVQLWMNSPGHRANILSTSTVHFGSAVARSRDGRLYWAMVSGAPR
jgi:uncharacterized protein YkwD